MQEGHFKYDETLGISNEKAVFKGQHDCYSCRYLCGFLYHHIPAGTENEGGPDCSQTETAA